MWQIQLPRIRFIKRQFHVIVTYCLCDSFIFVTKYSFNDKLYELSDKCLREKFKFLADNQLGDNCYRLSATVRVTNPISSQNIHYATASRNCYLLFMRQFHFCHWIHFQRHIMWVVGKCLRDKFKFLADNQSGDNCFRLSVTVCVTNPISSQNIHYATTSRNCHLLFMRQFHICHWIHFQRHIMWVIGKFLCDKFKFLAENQLGDNFNDMSFNVYVINLGFLTEN